MQEWFGSCQCEGAEDYIRNVSLLYTHGVAACIASRFQFSRPIEKKGKCYGVEMGGIGAHIYRIRTLLFLGECNNIAVCGCE